jgi:uncharacterized protein
MKIDGSSTLHADPARVWRAITDPGVLAGVIPGCQEFTPLGDNHFGLTVSIGVAAIKGSYAGEVRLSDLDVPRSLTMRAAGAGAPGTIDTTVEVRLTDLGDATTRLDYTADAVVGGMVGGVGQRVLASVARKTAGLFFAAIDDVLTGKQPAPPSGAAVPNRADLEERPFGATLRPAPATSGPGPLTVLVAVVAGAVAGAVAMAVGVLIGVRNGRQRP